MIDPEREATMAGFSRRAFLERATAGAAAAGIFSAATGLHGSPLGLPIGSQTWPHRQRVRSGDLAGLCKDLAALGVGTVELCSPGYPEFTGLADGKETRKVVEAHGLKCPSAHFTMDEMRTKQQQMIAWAKDIGMTQMGVATLAEGPPGGKTTMDAVKRAADEYNRIGETAAAAGIVQFLHDEGFEAAHADDRLVYEILIERLDPKYVKFQYQMSAMPQVGDVVTYFKKYPGRFISMHLQGVDPKAANRRAQLAVGKDGVDWAKVFAAAKTGGVQNYFVEQSWDLTVQSVAYLKTLSA
ncbi:MAG TPA: twin-arginine translocation signal domain-containing protein [Vicinamibacteria bacterium]|nr:twin-arginine translocation signal domain-containing protein [Vicinamibacteria bacterium]